MESVPSTGGNKAAGGLCSLMFDGHGFFWMSNPGLALVKSLQTLKTCVRCEYVKGPVQKDTIKGVAWEDWGLWTESHSVCPWRAWREAEKGNGRRRGKGQSGSWWSKMTGERLSR